MPVIEQLQLDLNRLTTADRLTKRRALERILNKVSSKSIVLVDNDGIVKSSVLVDHLCPMVLPMLEDPMEKCRELSLAILQQ
jgi:hypothetical protein